MDFASDALFNARRLRALTVVDAFTREAVAINVAQGIKGEQVVEAWRRDYNECRPHTSLGWMTPAKFA